MRPAPFDPHWPSIRAPVWGRDVIATGQPLAAAAALEIYGAGGNAVDAALAAAVALTVVEPTSNGIGGDAFALLWHGGRLHGLNASGRAPRALTPERFAGLEAVPRHGWLPVTVPGAPSAWAELAQRFGRLPLERIVAPALRWARDGYPVGPMTATAWARAATVLADQPGFAATFLPGGRAPREGELVRLPDHAATIERIAASNAAAFYRGELAERIAAASRDGGGLLDETDLAAHRADRVDPLALPFAGVEVHELPPNGQGIAALLALGILERSEWPGAPLGTADALHWQLEAMRLAFADLHAHVADPAAMRTGPDALLDPAYLAQRAAAIDPDRAGDPRPGVPPGSGTVYIAAAGADGTMISLIQSNYAGFGSGVVVPGTGIALQNRGAGFTLEAGHPNRVAGGKRPFHTIIPGFLTRAGAPLAAFGVMGGSMQAQGHLQLLLRVLVGGEDPQSALDAPRWQLLADGRVALEPGFPDAAVEGLRRRGHRLVLDERIAAGPRFFGGGQLAWRSAADGDPVYLAASDPRREGLAAAR